MAKSKLQIEIEARTTEANKQIVSLSKSVKNVGTATETTTKKVGFFRRSVDKLSDSMKVLSAVGLIGIVTGLIEAGKSLFTFNKELDKTRKLVSDLTGKSGEDLANFTAQVQATSDTFEQDFNEVLNATNTMSKELGVSFEESLKIINDGFINGADSSGELLSNIREYSTQADRMGLKAKELAKFLEVQAKEGIFSDKGIDTLAEATKRLGEMPQATKDALDAIGISSAQMMKDIESGEKTFFQATQEISKQLSTIPPQSAVIGQVLADVFGGAGEDAQGLVMKLHTINLESENTNEILTEQQQLQKQNLENSEKWNQILASLFGSAENGFSKMIADLTTFSLDILVGAIKGIKDLIHWFQDLTDASKVLRVTITWISQSFGLMWKSAKSMATNVVTLFKGMGGIIEGVFTLDTDKIKESIKATGEALKGEFANMQKQIEEAKNAVMREHEVSNDQRQAERRAERQQKEVEAVQATWQAVKTVETNAILNKDKIIANLSKKNTEKRLKKEVKLHSDAVDKIVGIHQKGESDKAQSTIANELATLEFQKGAGKQALQIASSKSIGSLIESIMTSLPFPLNTIVAAGANTVIGKLFDKIPAFEKGGIVEGNSFTGDKVQARVNSGEMILNRTQQKNLFDLANTKQSASGESVSINPTIKVDSRLDSSQIEIASGSIEKITNVMKAITPQQENDDIKQLANSIDELTNEIVFQEKNINIDNQLNVTPENLLEVTLEGERDKERREI